MNKKTWLIVIGAILITIIYLSYNITLGYDSSQYVWLSEMIAGNIDFSNWAPVRSFVFPLGIYVSNIIFGKSSIGLLLATFVFYSLMSISLYMMYNEIIEKNEKNNFIKVFFIIAFIIIVLLNPIIFGFYHVILTEFASITIAMISCYLSYKWIEIDIKNCKLKYIIFTILFMFLTVCSWHLKQTYILTIIVPLIIAAIISIIENFNIKNIIQRVVVVILCTISLFMSIKIWNNYMLSRNVKINDNTSSGGLLGNSIVEGVSNYRADKNKENYKRENVLVDDRINEEDRKIILDIIDKKSEKYKSFILLDKGTFLNPIGNRKVIYLKNENITVGEGIKFVFETLKNEPITVLNSYISNYLAIIDIYKVRVNVEYGNYYYIDKDYNLGQDLEITFLAFNIFRSMTNALDLPDFYSIYAKEYIHNNEYIKPINDYMCNMLLPAKVLFNVIMLLLPLLWIIKLIRYFIVRKKYNENYNKYNHLIFILYSYSLAQMAMYMLLGALMDRYAVAAYTCTLVSFIFDVYINIFRRNKYKLTKIESNNERQIIIKNEEIKGKNDEELDKKTINKNK